MNEERKIEVEQVDEVGTPPRARVESVAETFERKRDYLTGFLAGDTETAPASDPGNEAVRDAVVEVLRHFGLADA